MIKTLIFLRHAKAEDAHNAENDFKRQLTDRGRQDAKKMGDYFLSLNIIPDIIYCSTAYRTKQTLDIFNTKANLKAQIQFSDKLYLCMPSDFLDFFVNSTHNTILFVGHNMGISAIADWLCSDNVEELPTCGIAILQFENEIALKTGKLIAYQIPKAL